MGIHVFTRRRIGLLAAAGLMVVASGCGGAASGGSGSSGTADVAAAQAFVAKYTGSPSPFPATNKLSKPLPADTTIAYLQCSTPVCAIGAQFIKQATDALGVKLVIVKAGPSATEQQTALETIIALKPDGLSLPAIDPAGVSQQLKELTDAGIPISTFAMADTDKYGIQAPIMPNAGLELVGQLEAAWIVADQGAKANAVMYNIPELSFSPIISAAFKQKFTELCPGCEVREVNVSVAHLGTTAPSDMVSDLQSHPNTNSVSFAVSEMATGLPAALKTAGLDVKAIGYAPTPANLQDIKSGTISAGVGQDLSVMIWMTVDAIARFIDGQTIATEGPETLPPMQILEASDITFDPTTGYTGYSDYAQRFATLWGR